MIFEWLKRRRRRRWLAEPEPVEWAAWLSKNVWQFPYLDAEQRRRVRDFVCVLLREKHWSGGGGSAVTDEMRVTIAGQAALTTLGFGRPYYFDRLKSIIVYPRAYRAQVSSTDELLIPQHDGPMLKVDERLGESWQGGPIVLAWDAVIADGRNARSGRNLVLHEFAHHMDGLDGDTNGAPPLTDCRFEEEWYRVTDAEHARLLDFARRGEPTLLDHYGATNPAEFFAVVTECFFTQPHELAAEHAELFAVHCRLFGQDPRDWLPPNPLEAAG